MGKEIEQLTGKIGIPTITHQGLWTFLAQGIERGAMQKAQFNMEMEEFWAVFSGDLSGEDLENLPKCHAFAHWYKMGLPYIGTVACDAMYSWNRMSEPAELLYKEFVDFGRRLRCNYYMAECFGESLFKLFEGKMKKHGVGLLKTGRIQFIGKLE